MSLKETIILNAKLYEASLTQILCTCTIHITSKSATTLLHASRSYFFVVVVDDSEKTVDFTFARETLHLTQITYFVLYIIVALAIIFLSGFDKYVILCEENRFLDIYY